ncbi:MAG: hypothetical protein JJT96_18035 [Opitutales bacterium]|nr:hypothetical protein [Opitutales bacterium]
MVTLFPLLRPGFAVLAALVFFAGCQSTPSERARADSALFDSYPAEVRQNLLSGRVEPGYDKEMVRIALGNPDRTRTRTTEQAEETVWIYTRSRPGLSLGLGGARGGGRTTVGTGVGVSTGGTTTEQARVIFRNGIVHSVEETL